jgi:hypothetical protein
VDACTNACLTIAGALGPFGELLVVIAAGVVAWFSRRQVKAAKSETKAVVQEKRVVEATAEAYKTTVLSMRPGPMTERVPMLAPAVPQFEIRGSMPTDEEGGP